MVSTPGTAATAGTPPMDAPAAASTDAREAVVDPELALAYAHASNDLRPTYRSGEQVPPLTGAALLSPTVGDLYGQILPTYPLVDLIHMGHAVNFHRPLRGGEHLLVSGVLASVQPSPMGALLANRYVITDPSGAIVQDHSSSVLVPSWADAAAFGDPPPDPAPATLRSLKTRHERVVALTDDQALRFCAASGDWQPIHCSDAAARSAGLPGVIVHGMCTMAICFSVVTDLAAGGDPDRIERLSLRFTRPVFPGRPLTVQVSDALEVDGESWYSVKALADRKPVVRHCRAVVR